MKLRLILALLLFCFIANAQQAMVFQKKKNPKHTHTFILPADVMVKPITGEPYEALLTGSHDSTLTLRPMRSLPTRDTAFHNKFMRIAKDKTLTKAEKVNAFNNLSYPDSAQVAYNSLQSLGFSTVSRKYGKLKIGLEGALMAIINTSLISILFEEVSSDAPTDHDVHLAALAGLVGFNYALFKTSRKIIRPLKWQIAR